MGETHPHFFIPAIHPYFLDKGSLWFQEHDQEVTEALATQAFFQEHMVRIAEQEERQVSSLLRKLDEMGYEKVLAVENPGEFSVRGGILDVFPINNSSALRIEFLGNTIERISPFGASIADEDTARTVLKKRLSSQRIFSDLHGLQPGDYLVHLDHGIARFTGYEIIGEQEYYVLAYADKDKLFVPKGLERKLSMYVGLTEPRISRMGSVIWFKTKKKMREAAEKLARELLETYAHREIAERPSYESSGDIEKALAATFPYKETPDQEQAVLDIFHDLSSPRPMDRLVCGDVGFGKTEIALRAMVKAASSGFQSALLAPTTILARQHEASFRERLGNLPVTVALLSRMQTKIQQKKVLNDLREGKVDIIIGTHRLLSKDVVFSRLGLLVIDDEQRFGVKQKENFRQMRASLDVLSLSATPVPRTLSMALSSLKQVSFIQTPPQGRLPIRTIVARRSEEAIKKAINEELARNGQVYYLHNRIGTIEQVKRVLERMVPKACITTIHGRMPEEQIASAIDSFKAKKYNVLLATTIIENGIDLPMVNTIVVEDASKLGLSQAYQLKGRVGRSSRQAHAFFFYGGKLTPQAKLRLKALKEAEELGSGYRIALKDLEIRGAGNVLGKEQSGNVNAIGLNLYCQMLHEAVEKLQQARDILTTANS